MRYELVKRTIPRSRQDGSDHSAPPRMAKVQIPFWLLDPSKLRSKLNLFDDGAVVWWVATGEEPALAEPPHDPLTSWVALAYVGGIEQGGPGLDPKLDREARLQVASEVLSEEDLVVVETIAIPRRYRCLTAQDLEKMIRNAPSYVDRLWAACWLTLTGWTESCHCDFKDVCAEFPMGEIDESVHAAFAREQGVMSEDLVGMARVGRTHEAGIIHQRLSICQTYYGLNGPPPYEHVRQTIPALPGWRTVSRLVPDGARW